jgi:four helix bundle protein
MSIKSYRDLDVWKLSIEFAKDIYNITKNFPKDETYGLTQQIRRAAVSIPSNIAEGSGRRSTQEFCRFTNISSGSLCEVETQILLASELQYVTSEQSELLFKKADRISKMLYALYKSLNSKAAGC